MKKLTRDFMSKKLKLSATNLKDFFVPSIAFDPEEFPDLQDTIEWSPDGFDLTKELEIKLYEKPVDKKQGGQMAQSGKPMQIVPQYFPKKIQKAQNYFTEYKNEEFEVAIKLDGQAFTLSYHKNEFKLYAGAKKVNYDEKKPDSDFARYLQKLGIVAKLKKLNQNVAIIGDFVGPDIANNREKFDTQEYFVSDVWDTDKQEFLDLPARTTIVQSIFGSTDFLAPVIETIKIFSEYKSDGEIEEYAIAAKINGSFAQGIVCKMVSNRAVSFFVDSEKYIQKHKK